MNTNNAIEARNMTKYFKWNKKAHTLKEIFRYLLERIKRSTYCLKNINLDIRKGESVCLIGTNGSGKSTLEINDKDYLSK
ncbi:MAG: ATP-binding cassette domain-containing protein [Thomasclavelia sp.]